jgi:hypothetical protein
MWKAVFALLAVFFALLSGTTAQQIARELEETKRRLREAEARNVSPSNGTP